MDVTRDLRDIPTLYRETRATLVGLEDPKDVLARLCALAVERIDGAEQAGIASRRGDVYRTLASTAPLVDEVDVVQHRLRSGPCVDAMHDEHVYLTGDLAHEPRWPEFGRAANDLGVTSMLSHRLFLEDDEAIAALNLYSTQADAFAGVDQTLVVLLATLGAAAIAQAAETTRAQNLVVALENSREIGIAIGILMTTYRINREEGFGILRLFSQRSHRKLSAIAAEIADTGTLPDLPLSAPPGEGRRSRRHAHPA